MFGALTEKMNQLFSHFNGKKTMSEENLSDAVREIRLALLEADVNYKVASDFVKRVKEKAIGTELLKSVKAGDQFTKIIYDELIELMGGKEPSINVSSKPTFIMMCGLQGSGKTSTTGKLAKYFSKQGKGKTVLVAACDLQRLAAVEQLKRVGASAGATVFFLDDEKDPRIVAKKAKEKALKEGFDVLIIDTAGRLHIDEPLMEELKEIKKILTPHEVLFVANATTGQDAVKTAKFFDEKIGITGSILTMLDGNARAGAALSIVEVTGKPLIFETIGEKVDDLQLFNPKSMADRILGMGDVINLVKKAEQHIDSEESLKMEKKIKQASFHYDDYIKMMAMVKKMGTFKSLLKMMPGFSSLGDVSFSEKEFKEFESIILSMTPDERKEKVELTHPRRKRIAKGSGIKIEKLNQMIKNFKRTKQMMKGITQLKKTGLKEGLSDIKKKLGSKLWD